MKILAIDPGNEKSAFVIFDTETQTIVDKAIIDNMVLKTRIMDDPEFQYDWLVIEMIASYGMPVGKTVFETCVWIGMFIEAAQKPYQLVYRKDEKMHLCGSMKAKDSNIRQALLDRLGKDKTKGCSKDIWAALAVAVTFDGMNMSTVNYEEIPF